MTKQEFDNLKIDDKVRIEFDWEPRIHIKGNGFVTKKNLDDSQWTDVFVIGMDDSGNVFQGWFPRENATVIQQAENDNDIKAIL